MPAFGGRLTDDEIDAVSAYVAESAAKSKVSVAAAFEPDGTKLADCKADSACFEQAFGNLAYNEGPKRALAVFADKIETDQTVSVCHRIAHSLGAGGLAHYEGDVGLAFADGSAVCWSGYYHGILERAYAGVSEEDLPAVSRRLCESSQVRATDFVAYQCVHGLGHGLMIFTDYDMPLSLETCDALATSWDQTSCTGGVFMENLQTSYGTRSKWLRDDDPLYPCPTVAERHKLYCYLMVTSRILDVVGGDWQQTVDWCRKAEPNWVATCFQSLGRDASGARSRRRPRSSVSARSQGTWPASASTEPHATSRAWMPAHDDRLDSARQRRQAIARHASTASAPSSAASRARRMPGVRPAAARCRSNTGTNASPAQEPDRRLRDCPTLPLRVTHGMRVPAAAARTAVGSRSSSTPAAVTVTRSQRQVRLEQSALTSIRSDRMSPASSSRSPMAAGRCLRSVTGSRRARSRTSPSSSPKPHVQVRRAAPWRHSSVRTARCWRTATASSAVTSRRSPTSRIARDRSVRSPSSTRGARDRAHREQLPPLHPRNRRGRTRALRW